MENVNWLLIAPLFLLQLILLVTALINLKHTQKTNGPKWMWALFIIFINTLGPIIYFLFGRKKTA